MTTDLHSAVRTAVDEARRLAQAASKGPWRIDGMSIRGFTPLNERDCLVVKHTWPQEAAHIVFWNPSRALAMCDWADDVLARHTPEPWSINVPDLVCTKCVTGDRDCYQGNDAWPCAELVSVAAAFGVETGETP